jgi:hypothetical protein
LKVWLLSVAVTCVKPSFTTSAICLVRQRASRKNWFNFQSFPKKAACGLLFYCLRFLAGPSAQKVLAVGGVIDGDAAVRGMAVSVQADFQ